MGPLCDFVGYQEKYTFKTLQTKSSIRNIIMIARLILRKSHKIISFLLLGNKSASTPIKPAKSPKYFGKNVHSLHIIPVDFYVTDKTVPDRSAEWHAQCVKMKNVAVQFTESFLEFQMSETIWNK